MLISLKIASFLFYPAQPKFSVLRNIAMGLVAPN